jgi:hypothetical protein
MRTARHLLAIICTLFFIFVFAHMLDGAIRGTVAPLIALAACGLAGSLIVLVILLRVARWNHRVNTLHCPECGYDMHVTPHRCPECGWESIHTESGLHPFLIESALNLSRDRLNEKK